MWSSLLKRGKGWFQESEGFLNYSCAKRPWRNASPEVKMQCRVESFFRYPRFVTPSELSMDLTIVAETDPSISVDIMQKLDVSGMSPVHLKPVSSSLTGQAFRLSNADVLRSFISPLAIFRESTGLEAPELYVEWKAVDQYPYEIAANREMIVRFLKQSAFNKRNLSTMYLTPLSPLFWFAFHGVEPRKVATRETCLEHANGIVDRWLGLSDVEQARYCALCMEEAPKPDSEDDFDSVLDSTQGLESPYGRVFMALSAHHMGSIPSPQARPPEAHESYEASGVSDSVGALQH